MTVADGIAGPAHGFLADGHVAHPQRLGEVTLTGTLTMDKTYRPVLRLDPGGAGRDVLLPVAEEGLGYEIVNIADAAEALTVKDSTGVTTVVTLPQNEKAYMWCDGTSWYHTGIVTIQLA